MYQPRNTRRCFRSVYKYVYMVFVRYVAAVKQHSRPHRTRRPPYRHHRRCNGVAGRKHDANVFINITSDIYNVFVHKEVSGERVWPRIVHTHTALYTRCMHAGQNNNTYTFVHNNIIIIIWVRGTAVGFGGERFVCVFCSFIFYTKYDATLRSSVCSAFLYKLYQVVAHARGVTVFRIGIK